jgi:hypothetical protein
VGDTVRLIAASPECQKVNARSPPSSALPSRRECGRWGAVRRVRGPLDTRAQLSSGRALVAIQLPVNLVMTVMASITSSPVIRATLPRVSLLVLLRSGPTLVPPASLGKESRARSVLTKRP